MEQQPTIEKNVDVKPTIEQGIKEQIMANMPPDEGVAKGLTKEDLKINETKQKSLKEKILAMFGKGEENTLKKGEARLAGNATLNEEFERLTQVDPERARKFKLAMGKYLYTKWDPEKNDYIDTAKYTEFVNK